MSLRSTSSVRPGFVCGQHAAKSDIVPFFAYRGYSAISPTPKTRFRSVRISSCRFWIFSRPNTCLPNRNTLKKMNSSARRLRGFVPRRTSWPSCGSRRSFCCRSPKPSSFAADERPALKAPDFSVGHARSGTPTHPSGSTKTAR